VSETCWRLLRDAPADGAWNMAADEAVAHAVGEGRVPPTMRFYDWSRPTVSLGRLQRSAGAVDLPACRRLEIDIVRRPTGGRAVLHARELTYSVAAPLDGAWGSLSVAESFCRVGHALVAGLRRLGVAATIGDGKSERSEPRTDICFQSRRMPAILVSGKKLIGSAQRRWRRSLLQHGSILLEFDAVMQRAVFPAWRDSAAVVWLGAVLGEIPRREILEAALMAGWTETMDTRCEPGRLLAAERREAEELARTRYREGAWTFQR
jgi:lipoate-protein ligase A